MRVKIFLEHVWRWLGEDKRLTYLLASFLVIHMLIFSLPQAPVDQADTSAFTRWLAELRPSLGSWVQPLAALDMLSLRTSVWMRALLVALSLVVAVRLSMLKDAWKTLSTFKRWISVSIGIGAVCFLIGWGMQTLWGWTETDLIAWPDTQIVIGDRGVVLPPAQGGMRLQNGMYGLYLVPQGNGRGVAVQAFDIDDVPLFLSLSTRSANQTLLRIALTSQLPEAYFALLEADIIVRISQLHTAENVPLKVEVYRSAIGALLTELNLAEEQDVLVNEGVVRAVRLHFTPYLLPRFTAIYNPGAPLQVLGAILFVGGCILQMWGSKQPLDEALSTQMDEDELRTIDISRKESEK